MEENFFVREKYVRWSQNEMKQKNEKKYRNVNRSSVMARKNNTLVLVHFVYGYEKSRTNFTNTFLFMIVLVVCVMASLW